MDGMFLSRPLRRCGGQSTTEYMVVVSVISIAVLAVLAWFSDPSSPPQQAGDALMQNYSQGLTNNDGGSGAMQVGP